jgi:hypothetical protein
MDCKAIYKWDSGKYGNTEFQKMLMVIVRLKYGNTESKKGFSKV